MSRTLCAMAAACAALLATGAGTSDEPVLPGTVLTLAAAPAGKMHAPADHLAPRPDLDPRVLESATYAEYMELDGSLRAVVTCRTRRSAFASLASYEPDGTCVVHHAKLLLPPDDLSMMTFELSQDSPDSQTRLMLWANPPSPGRLRAALLDVQPASSAFPDLLAERWFTRRAPSGGGPPWEDNLRGIPEAPPGYPPGLTPSLTAELSPQGQAAAKDCTVLTTADTTIAFDDFGAYGCWSLAFGGELLVIFEMPVWPLPRQAHLVILGADGAPLSWPGLQQLEVQVNGWATTDLSLAPPVQQSPLSLSPYLRAGDNRISLRLQSFSGKAWLIRGIQVWSQ